MITADFSLVEVSAAKKHPVLLLYLNSAGKMGELCLKIRKK
jgi:hypothetical protein